MGRGWRRTASQEPRQSLTRQTFHKILKSGLELDTMVMSGISISETIADKAQLKHWQ